MSDLIKVVVLDSSITSSNRFASMQYADDVVRRYKMQKNGFRFTFVQELKYAKTIFDYSKYNPGSDANYSLLLFNPNLEEKTAGELKQFLEEIIKCVPVIMCTNRDVAHWETNKGVVKDVSYNSSFPLNLTSIREGSGYFLELENIMKESLKRF